MNIAIIGASGFVGTAVTKLLLEETDHQLTLFSHRASKIRYSQQQERRLRHVDGSVLNKADVNRALRGCDQAVYLVHLMGQRGYHDAEQRAATIVAQAAQWAGLTKIVYVGGMGEGEGELPGHLGSRLQTGQLLQQTGVTVIELRTPMVIGNGGAGYDMLRWLVCHSYVLPVPRWANGVTKPITVTDVARYVAQSLLLPKKGHNSVAIGGPEALSYSDVARRYATKHRRRLLIVPLPLISLNMATWLLRRVVPGRTAKLVADMLGSSSYNTTNTNQSQVLFPAMTPEPIDSAL